MSTPVLESIAVTLADRIKDGTYTAPYQIRKVVRPNKLQTNKELGDLECMVRQGTPQRNEELDYDGNPMALGFDVPYVAVVFLRPSDTDTTAIDTIANYVMADVVKAITTPNATWHNWGSKAINSTYDLALEVSDDASQAAVIVTVNVQTRFSITDPYTFRA